MYSIPISLILILMSFTLINLSSYFKMMSINLNMEWIFYSYNSMNLEMIVFLDWKSILFSSLVLHISSCVILYSMNYMNLTKTQSRFMYLLLMFMISMIFMIICPNLMSIMLGWDGLGLISFCLIIYYMNSNSFKSGMLTFICNRIGDVIILLIIALLTSLGSWNLFLTTTLKINYIFMFLILMCAITKSAQLPYSIWLPAAMAAPTPISALVHSSTLVTAGVYMLIRYNLFMNFDSMNIMLFLSSITMFLAGLMAMFTLDLKKIIALSTLSQLSFMFSILSLNLPNYALFHLFTHALFKSLLFLCAGQFIHFMNNIQDIRFYGSLYFKAPICSTSFLIASITLCGMPFLTGFYSKDLILETFNMNKMNFYSILLILLATMFTTMYTMRLNWILFMSPINCMNSFIVIEENTQSNISMIILLIHSIISGKLLFNMFFISPIPIIMSMEMKMLISTMFMLSLLLTSLIMKFNKTIMKHKSFKFITSFSNLNNLYNKFYKSSMKLGIMFKNTFENSMMTLYIFTPNNIMKLIKIKFNVNINMKHFFMLLTLFMLLFMILSWNN